MSCTWPGDTPAIYPSSLPSPAWHSDWGTSARPQTDSGLDGRGIDTLDMFCTFSSCFMLEGCISCLNHGFLAIWHVWPSSTTMPPVLFIVPVPPPIVRAWRSDFRPEPLRCFPAYRFLRLHGHQSKKPEKGLCF